MWHLHNAVGALELVDGCEGGLEVDGCCEGDLKVTSYVTVHPVTHLVDWLCNQSKVMQRCGIMPSLAARGGSSVGGEVDLEPLIAFHASCKENNCQSNPKQLPLKNTGPSTCCTVCCYFLDYSREHGVGHFVG